MSTAEDVHNQLLEDYPEKALGWIQAKTTRWSGPKRVAITRLDFSTRSEWRASREPIQPYADRISSGRMKPIVAVKKPGQAKLVIVDGHHRALAYERLGRDPVVYVGTVPSEKGPWDELHTMQKKGSSKGSWVDAPMSARDTAPAFLMRDSVDSRAGDASIAIVWETTERVRVLTVSRPEPPPEMALPGGLVDPGESPRQAVIRELREECGIELVDVWEWAPWDKSGSFEPLKSPDGRPLHVFVCYAWTGKPYAAEPNTKVSWLTLDELLEQADLFKPTVKEIVEAMRHRQLSDGKRTLDLGVGDVHVPTAGGFGKKARMAEISTKTRNSLPAGKFALPASRKYPIHDAAHTRNAAARLAQAKKGGKVSAGEYRTARAAIRRAAKHFGIDTELRDAMGYGGGSLRKTVGQGISVRAQIRPGGHLHIRHLSDDGRQCIESMRDGTLRLRDVRPLVQGAVVDPASAGVTLKGPPAWKDGTPKTLVWVQLAETGAWKGHPAGAFEMTPSTFSEIVRNFVHRGLPVQFDMDHASEADPTSGNLPVVGAPAHGWIHRLDNRSSAGLWGLTEWLDYAREGIHEGKFAYVSPAIRFGSKDAVTGQSIGARLTSAAITNSPFLTHLEGLRAANDRGAVRETESMDYQINGGAKAILIALGALPWSPSRGDTMTVPHGTYDQRLLKGGESAFAHKPHEYMPSVKRALGMHELSTGQQCADMLEQLRDHIAECDDAEGTHEGVELSQYTRPLRSLVDAQPGETWEEILDAVEALIQNAIENHEIIDHHGSGGGASMNTTGGQDDRSRSTIAASDRVNGDNAMDESQKKIQELTTTNADLTRQLTETKTLLTDAQKKAALAEGKSTELEAKCVALDTKCTAIEANAKLLSDWRETEIDKGLDAKVEQAFQFYKDERKLTDESKKHMKVLLKANSESFDHIYPPPPPGLGHMLRDLTGGFRPPTPRMVEGGEPEESKQEIATRLMKDNAALTWSDAINEAAKIHASRRRFAA